jgi:hypothetical protein
VGRRLGPRDAVADRDPVADQRLGQQRICAAREFEIARQGRPQRIKVPAEVRRIAHSAESRKTQPLSSIGLCPQAMRLLNAAAARASPGPHGTGAAPDT